MAEQHGAAMHLTQEFLICLHNLTHRHDIHLQLTSFQWFPFAIHPAEFLKLHAERLVVNLPLLVPQQRIGKDEVTSRQAHDIGNALTNPFVASSD